MRASKPQRHRTICRLWRLDGHSCAPAGHLRGAVGVDGAFDQRRAALAGRSRDDVARWGHECPQHDGHARLDDARLFEGNRLERVAEMLLMIEVDGGDGARNRRDHVCRVEPSAEPDLDHANLDRGAPKQLEGDRRRGLEERRLHGQDAGRSQSIRAGQHVVHNRLEGGRLDGTIVDDEPLVEIAQMGRGITPGVDTGGAQRRVRHRGHRSLAVGARDVQGGEAPLRMTERLAEGGDVIEPQLDAEGLERKQTIEQLRGQRRTTESGFRRRGGERRDLFEHR